MYSYRKLEEIRAKDASSKRMKRVMEKANVQEHDDSIPPSSLPSASPRCSVLAQCSPRVTDSPYNTDKTLDCSEGYESPHSKTSSLTPFHTNSHDTEENDIKSLHSLRVIREALERWLGLGSVDDWAATFRKAYDDAATGGHGDTQDTIDTFLNSVVEHVQCGKDILFRFAETSVVRLEKGDRMLAMDMERTLHCGVSILEAHLSIIALFSPLACDYQSKICGYRGFTADL